MLVVKITACAPSARNRPQYAAISSWLEQVCRPILKLFQNFNKPGIQEHGIIGDNWQVKVSGGCGNKPVMQLGDVIDLRSCFKDFKAQRFKLIILAFEKILGLKQADIDSILFK